MISFVLPWYKRLPWFELALPFNAPMFATDAEVLLCLDEPSEEKAVLELITLWPNIRFVVLVNDEDHEWRPPSKAINAGIMKARGKNVCIISPETIIRLPHPSYLAHKTIEGFRAGILWNLPIPTLPKSREMAEWVAQYSTRWAPQSFGYGFLMVRHELIKKVGGYDEARKHYGADDDCIRIRLLRNGIPGAIDPNITVLHPSHECSARGQAREPLNAEVKFPAVNTFRVAFDWKK